MTIFTDALAAVEEAEWLAEQTDKRQAIVTEGEALSVMPESEARFQRREILEVCAPVIAGMGRAADMYSIRQRLKRAGVPHRSYYAVREELVDMGVEFDVEDVIDICKARRRIAA